MKTIVLNFLYSILASLIGLVRDSDNSEGDKPATSQLTDQEKLAIINQYIRDSEGETQAEPRKEVPVYRVYSKEHLEGLKKIFPKERWSKNTTVEELAFNAGQLNVIDTIEARLKAEGIKTSIIK